ncbi:MULTISPECIES: hypothetical protein [Nocardiaceae]|uniref:hypothetical protein n=1 Tax=Nocardiaceae TaxID=85025 RepID=UPI0012D31A11|nr:hypothetical protein [Rhodococcus fascians]
MWQLFDCGAIDAPALREHEYRPAPVTLFQANERLDQHSGFTSAAWTADDDHLHLWVADELLDAVDLFTASNEWTDIVEEISCIS